MITDVSQHPLMAFCGLRRMPAGLATCLLLGCHPDAGGGSMSGDAGLDGGSGGLAGDDASPGASGGENSDSDGSTPPGGTPAPTVCVPGVPATSQLPLLTRAQYDNTIRDLLQLDSQPSSMLAPDVVGSVDERAWKGFQNAARTLAAEVMESPTSRAHVVPCTPTGDGAACASQLIREFGARAFRRPLDEEELARFETLYANRAELTETGTFEEAVQLILEGFLLSPSFLMRAETEELAEGEYYVLDDYEVATRLSYMLWGSMPDDALFEAAAAGQLSTPDEILAQTRRMLQAPQARAKVTDFHRHYMHMGPGTRWAELSRDANVYPAFDPAQVPAMTEETERFFDYVVFEQGGTFQDLLTLPIAFVNADLAPLYGLDPAEFGDELVAVDLDPTTRAGIFTRVGFLASHASFDRTSPILRGAFLQEEVLCTDIPPPPPDVEGTPLPTELNGEELRTNRERVDAQTSPAECAGCHHGLINPMGFALETYDGVGAIQTMDNGVPIDSTATIPLGPESVTVDGPIELMQAIAASPSAQTCYARKWVTYAYERDINSADSCTVEELAAQLEDGELTVLALLESLTQTESFRYRAVEVDP